MVNGTPGKWGVIDMILMIFRKLCIYSKQVFGNWKKSSYNEGLCCDAPKPGGLLTTRQPAEYS